MFAFFCKIEHRLYASKMEKTERQLIIKIQNKISIWHEYAEETTNMIESTKLLDHIKSIWVNKCHSGIYITDVIKILKVTDIEHIIIEPGLYSCGVCILVEALEYKIGNIVIGRFSNIANSAVMCKFNGFDCLINIVRKIQGLTENNWIPITLTGVVYNFGGNPIATGSSLLIPADILLINFYETADDIKLLNRINQRLELLQKFTDQLNKIKASSDYISNLDKILAPCKNKKQFTGKPINPIELLSIKNGSAYLGVDVSLIDCSVYLVTPADIKSSKVMAQNMYEACLLFIETKLNFANLYLNIYKEVPDLETNNSVWNYYLNNKNE
jgi:hypothetical protein